jgi:hypothetical protein
MADRAASASRRDMPSGLTRMGSGAAPSAAAATAATAAASSGTAEASGAAAAVPRRKVRFGRRDSESEPQNELESEGGADGYALAGSRTTGSAGKENSKLRGSSVVAATGATSSSAAGGRGVGASPSAGNHSARSGSASGRSGVSSNIGAWSHVAVAAAGNSSAGSRADNAMAVDSNDDGDDDDDDDGASRGVADMAAEAAAEAVSSLPADDADVLMLTRAEGATQATAVPKPQAADFDDPDAFEIAKTVYEMGAWLAAGRRIMEGIGGWGGASPLRIFTAPLLPLFCVRVQGAT